MQKRILSDAERAYLQELNENPVFQGIVNKLSEFTPPPRFKPGRGDEFYRWIYESGGHDAIEGMLRVLTGRDVTINYEGHHD